MDGVQLANIQPSQALDISMPQPAPAADTGLSFREVLRALNPLQYLPVVGTIYRAITGDTIAEPLRVMGSLVVGGLMGGPVGIITGIASMALQKITGIDIDGMGQSVLHSLGIGSTPDAVPSAVAATPDPAPTDPSPTDPAPVPVFSPARVAWTPVQLAAYGVPRPARKPPPSPPTSSTASSSPISAAPWPPTARCGWPPDGSLRQEVRHRQVTLPVS